MGWKVPLIILLLAVLFGFILSRLLNQGLITDAPDPGDGWWGRGTPEVSGKQQDTSVRQFQVNVSDDILTDLRSRLKNTRFVDPLENAAFHYGTNAGYMKTLQQYWLEEYSWRDAEKELNQYDHFITNIEGIDVHFIHVKPKLAAGQKAKPIVLIHGWPGSFYDFYKIIPMLTDPTSHGGSADDVFEVICPSIPGYAFSEPPHKRGFTITAAARVFHKLMMRVGLEEYYVQGGDWGAAMSVNMGLMFPKNVKGIHNNDVCQVSPSTLLYPFLASLWPSFFLPSEVEQKFLLPPGDRPTFVLQEMAYFYMHMTKPDDIGQGLNDSPIGLAAYMLGKFSALTNKDWRDLADGGLTKVWTMDELVTHLMIYWVSGDAASPLRLAKEEFGEHSSGYVNTHATQVPFGYANFPNEYLALTEWMLQPYNHKIVHWSYQPRGGHFPAMEVPDLLAEDIRVFVRKAEAL